MVTEPIDKYTMESVTYDLLVNVKPDFPNQTIITKADTKYAAWLHIDGIYTFSVPLSIKLGVALMGCNTTGPPWSVGCPTARAPGPPAGSVTDDDRCQLVSCKTILAH